MSVPLALFVTLNGLRAGLPFLVIVVGLGLGAFAIWALVRYFLRQSLPRHSGTISVSGVEGPVTISRDSYGVPTIEAESLHDVLFGQGFAQAQDRLW